MQAALSIRDDDDIDSLSQRIHMLEHKILPHSISHAGFLIRNNFMDNYYRNFNNIKILPVDTFPSTKWVKNTNQVFLSVKVDIRNGRIIILSVIDNLLKGQSGQAIQNLNIMSGFSMDDGLELTNKFP